MAEPPFLEIDGISRYFGGLRAVDDVSFTVAENELVGVIGPNGAGKTTLFNVVSGALPPTHGAVRFEGRPLTGLRTHAIAKRGVARTFQNLRVFPDITVFDNVSVGAIGYYGHSLWRSLWPGLGRDDGVRITELTWQILERTRLAEHAGELAGNLPYGRRKYLEIARALALRPKLLLLDEPAAGLNSTETVELAGFIRALRGEGLTMLLVEHDMGLVMGVSDRVVVLDSGRKIADAAPDAVRRDPAVLAAYLGSDT
jgi:branched-chain amino acid transport system ATP-binding protein